MPSTVADVFAAAGLRPAGVVRWGTSVPEKSPGLYVVALTEDPNSLADVRTTAPLDQAAFAHLLSVRSQMRLNKRAESASELAARLEAFWLRDEVVVYIGLARPCVPASASTTTPRWERESHMQVAGG